MMEKKKKSSDASTGQLTLSRHRSEAEVFNRRGETVFKDVFQ